MCWLRYLHSSAGRTASVSAHMAQALPVLCTSLRARAYGRVRDIGDASPVLCVTHRHALAHARPDQFGSLPAAVRWSQSRRFTGARRERGRKA